MANGKIGEWFYRSDNMRSKKETIPGTKKTETVVQVKNKNGNWFTLLNPSQRGRKYAKDVHNKHDTITKKPLNNTQLAFRSGYLKARSDNAKAWKSNKAKRDAKRAEKKG